MAKPLAHISGQILADAELLYDFLSACPPLPAKADVILATGSHDCRAADHAAALYLQGLAPLITPEEEADIRSRDAGHLDPALRKQDDFTRSYPQTVPMINERFGPFSGRADI